MNENDPVRLAVFAGRRGETRLETTPFRRRRETYVEFRPFVSALRPAGETRVSAAVAELIQERRAPGMVIVISDFLVSPGDYEEGLGRLLNFGHEVKVLHVLGDQESTGGYPPGNYGVRDCESGEFRDVVFGPAAAEGCRRRVADHAARLSEFCSHRGIMHAPAFGASHLDEIMSREFPRLGVIN